jgi:hypothetical protein
VFIENVGTGSEDLEVETMKFQLEEIEGDVLARARHPPLGVKPARSRSSRILPSA